MSTTWIRQHLNGSLSPVHAGPSFLSLPSSQVTPNTFLQTPCSAFELISLPLSQRQDLYSIINPFQSPHSPHKSIVTAYSIPPLQSKKKKKSLPNAHLLINYFPMPYFAPLLHRLRASPSTHV